MERCLTSRTGVSIYGSWTPFIHKMFLTFFSSSKTEHKYSEYTFAWHYIFGKQAFNKGKLYTVARAIVAKTSPGYKRLEMILNLSRKTNVNGELEKHPREADMGNQVMAVAGIISSKSVLGLFDNSEMRTYVYKLDPQHSPPRRLERIRIAIVLIDAVMREWDLILAERRAMLYDKFISGEIGKSAFSLVRVASLRLNELNVSLFEQTSGQTNIAENVLVHLLPTA